MQCCTATLLVAWTLYLCKELCARMRNMSAIQNQQRHLQNQPTFSCCPLTVHVLLHITPTIQVMGPVWTYWAYPMERYCSGILHHVQSHWFPYTSINKYVTSHVQLTQISLLYNLDKDGPRPSHDQDVHLPLCESFACHPTCKFNASCTRSVIYSYSTCAICCTSHRFFVEAAHCNTVYSLWETCQDNLAAHTKNYSISPLWPSMSTRRWQHYTWSWADSTPVRQSRHVIWVSHSNPWRFPVQINSFP